MAADLVAEPSSSEPVERIRDTFPLSRWADLFASWARLDDAWEKAASAARQAGAPLPPGGPWAGMPLPAGVDWAAYRVELIEREITATDEFDMSTGGAFRFEGGTSDIEYNPDGSLHHLYVSAQTVWRHVRTVIRHPDTVAYLQWEWDGTPGGQIAIRGLAADPDPARSCRLLTKAIPLLRDWEWRGQARPGPDELTDDEVRHDLEVALERCRKRGWEQPSLRQLAPAHERRRDSPREGAGIAEAALRERRRYHPGPFRELVPWIRPRPKK